jgi:eukaryotic-like serine/threonine-protein kinase
LLVVLDDAERAGDVVLDAIHIATSRGDAAVWACAVGSPDLSTKRPQLAASALRFDQFALSALSRPSMSELCRSLLAPASEVPQVVVDALLSRAESSPGLLVELIRGLSRAGAIRRRSSGDGFYVALEEVERLPAVSSLAVLAEANLASLEPQLVAHAIVAAILGVSVHVRDFRGVVAELDSLGLGASVPLDASVGLLRLYGDAKDLGRDFRLSERGGARRRFAPRNP